MRLGRLALVVAASLSMSSSISTADVWVDSDINGDPSPAAGVTDLEFVQLGLGGSIELAYSDNDGYYFFDRGPAGADVIVYAMPEHCGGLEADLGDQERGWLELNLDAQSANATLVNGQWRSRYLINVPTGIRFDRIRLTVTEFCDNIVQVESVRGFEPDVDRDTFTDFNDMCPTVWENAQVDVDGDGVGDACDNCIYAKNGPSDQESWSVQCDDQEDAELDGFGQVCDFDYNQNGAADSGDLSAMLGFLGNPAAAQFDNNCNAAPDSGDLAKLLANIGNSPGPSGLDCSGTIPCKAPVCTVAAPCN